jgi:hypothetical protein
MDDSQEIATMKAKVDEEIKLMDAATLKTKHKGEESLRKFVRDLCLKLAEGIGIGLGKAALESLIRYGLTLIT